MKFELPVVCTSLFGVSHPQFSSYQAPCFLGFPRDMIKVPDAGISFDDNDAMKILIYMRTTQEGSKID